MSAQLQYKRCQLVTIADKLVYFICRDISQGLKFQWQIHDLVQILSDEYVGLTTDEWTSIATDVSVTATAHYMDARWKIRSMVLNTGD